MEKTVSLEQIVTASYAAKQISSHLSDRVNFEVQDITLLYSQEQVSKMMTSPADSERRVTLSWRFTLRNENDGINYVCYVDAKNGGNFRLFSR